MGNKSSRSRSRSSAVAPTNADIPPPPYQGTYPDDGLLKVDPKNSLVYTNAPIAPTAAARQNSISEDALEMLRKYDILVLVDDSGSMLFDGGRSWNEVTSSVLTAALTRSLLRTGSLCLVRAGRESRQI